MAGSPFAGERGAGAACAALLLALAQAGCYAPEQADCQVRCALDQTCPNDMVCHEDFCRPFDHEPAICRCIAGETRLCGGGQGECTAGVQRCLENQVWEDCVGEVLPAPEVCDLKDNDCDGDVDNHPSDAPACELTVGVCARTRHACVDGQYAGACLAEYGADYQALESRCDGRDNDCDGVVDGRRAGSLADSSVGYALVGLDGGYALAWGTAAGAGVSWSAQLFDQGLVPLGAAVSLGTTVTPTTISGAGGGTRAWFVWQHTSASQAPALDEAGGAAVDLATPGAAAIPLSGVLHGQMRGPIRLGHDATGLVAAWPTDAGVGVSAWSSPGASPAVRLVVPPAFSVAEVAQVALSSAGTTVSMTGKRFTDAGTVDYFDGLQSLISTNFSDRFVYTGATVVDSPKGTQAVYHGLCDYDVGGFSCHKSFLVVDFNVWDGASVRREVRAAPVGALAGSHATATPVDVLASWVERGQLYVGTPVASSNGVRVRAIDTPGVVPLETRVANGGGELNAVVYRHNPSTGQLAAALVCAP